MTSKMSDTYCHQDDFFSVSAVRTMLVWSVYMQPPDFVEWLLRESVFHLF
jgi:hypothetical protein